LGLVRSGSGVESSGSVFAVDGGLSLQVENELEQMAQRYGAIIVDYVDSAYGTGFYVHFGRIGGC
jgi:hypothetical protein